MGCDPSTKKEERKRKQMKITLKDGSSKEYAESMRVIDIAADISEGLARMATAGEVNGEVVDLRTVVEEDCELSILTFQDEKGKGAFRRFKDTVFYLGIRDDWFAYRDNRFRDIAERWCMDNKLL